MSSKEPKDQGGKGLDKPIELVHEDGRTRDSTNREWRDRGKELRAEGWRRPDEEEETETGEGETGEGEAGGEGDEL